MFYFKLVSASTFVLGAGLSTPAFGQDSITESTLDGGDGIILIHERYASPIVVIGARDYIGPSLPSVVELSSDDIDDAQTPVISDVLARIPSVTVTRNGPVGALTSLRIRGADASQTLVIIDGVRVGDPTSPGGGFDFGSLLNTGIERIEVQRGSNSVTWGSDAIGGVVLIETLGPDNAPASQIYANYGSHDTARINARSQQQFGRFGIALGAGWFDSDGISSARVGTEADGFRQYSGNGRATLDLGDVNLSTALIYADSRLDLDGFGPPTFATFGDTAEFQRTQEIYGSNSIAHRISDNFTHRATIAIADINRDTFDPSAGAAPTFSARGRTTRYSWQGNWLVGIADARAVFGVDHARERAQTGDAFSSDRSGSHTTGQYLNIAFEPARQLRLIGGIRHDDHVRFGSAVVLSGDAVLAFENTTLHGAYSEGYKAPTLFQLSGSAGAFGNPTLNPERSRSYEVGVRQWVGDLVASVTAYRRDSRNLIDFVGCSGAGAPAICASGNRPFGTYDNVASARAQGIEADLLVPISDTVRLTAGYAHIATRDRAASSFAFGRRLARRPLNTANLGVRYDGDSFGAALDLAYVGSSFDNRSNSVRLDDYMLVGANVRYAISEQFDLYGRVENLFDAEYENVSGFGTYGRTVTFGVRARL